VIDIHPHPLYNVLTEHREQPVLKDLVEKDGLKLKAAAEIAKPQSSGKTAEEINQRVERHGYARYRCKRAC
jgi:hypothetical protein